MIGVVIGVLALGLMIGLGWLFTENDVRMQRHYQPQYEQVRRNTFEQSQAHVEGINTDIARYRVDFATAKTEEERAAIRLEILHTAGQLDPDLLTPDNAAFVRSLR